MSSKSARRVSRDAAQHAPAARCRARRAAARCSSGSGGSDVGAHTPMPPTASVQVLNGGRPHVPRRRGGAAHGQGERGQRRAADRVELAADFRSGRAAARDQQHDDEVHGPRRRAPTALGFELTVTDSTGNPAAQRRISSCCPRDSDKFLSLDVARGASFDTFEVVAALAGGAAHRQRVAPLHAGGASVSRLSVARSAPAADCSFDSAAFASGVPQSTTSGCLVEWLEDLTPEPCRRRHGVRGRVARGRHGAQRAGCVRVTRWWNSRFTLRVPRLDVQEFNQRFVDSARASALLDSFAAARRPNRPGAALDRSREPADATLVFPGLVYAAEHAPRSDIRAERASRHEQHR